MEGHVGQINKLLLFMMGIAFVCGLQCENCRNGCAEETGLCSGGCIDGWDGPTCSRRNVALHQKATQSSNYRQSSYGPSLAVDGITGHSFFSTPCTHTREGIQQANWTVTLDGQYDIYRFRIYNRDEISCPGQCGRKLNGFTLSVANSSFSQNYKVCYQDTTTDPEGPGKIIDGVCNSGPVSGDTVRIMINNSQPLTLCEVQIFLCANGTYGIKCEERCGNCAEGPSVCDTRSGHCPQRTPRCMLGYLPPKCDTVCSNGTYGSDCLEKCGNCADGQVACDATSGHCPNRTQVCILGYLPPKCDKDCNPGTYGPDCEMKCGHCIEGKSVCDGRSGHCPNRTPRCMSGYSGVTCNTECSNNTWGKDCLELCGKCYNKTECLVSTGDCPVVEGNLRCEPGYSGSDCMARVTAVHTDYTGVIVGCSVGIPLVFIIGVIILVVLIRRNSRNVQTGGAVSSGPNGTPTQESCVLPEVQHRSQMPEPSSVYNTCDTNSFEDHAYEAIRHYANLDYNK